MSFWPSGSSFHFVFTPNRFVVVVPWQGKSPNGPKDRIATPLGMCGVLPLKPIHIASSFHHRCHVVPGSDDRLERWQLTSAGITSSSLARTSFVIVPSTNASRSVPILGNQLHRQWVQEPLTPTRISSPRPHPSVHRRRLGHARNHIDLIR
jgi:hypothetical protein